MTKEELFCEFQSRVQEKRESLNKSDCPEGYPFEEYQEGWRSAFSWATDILAKLISDQPSLPSNLDEAASKWVEENATSCDYIGAVISEHSFKAGAEWMAGQGVKLKCWIARDECSGDESNLYIGQKKPRRIPETAPGFGMWCDYGEFMALPPDMFPELTYSDEPIEVELIIRKK